MKTVRPVSFPAMTALSSSVLVLSALVLSGCGATDEINLIAGDSRMTFTQSESGSYVRTDPGALGDLSDSLPEGVVPVGDVVSAQGTVPTAVVATPSAEGARSGGGFSLGNITFRTARAAERDAARKEAEAAGAPLPDDGQDQPGLLMRFLGMGGGSGPGSDTPQLGEDGLPVVTFDQNRASANNVNRYLWDATAQTLAFMPLAVADQRRGLYVTDWHTDAERRPERVRVDVQHTGGDLGPGSFHVTVYRQVLEQGVWRDAPSSLPTARALEERILLAAQKLKIAGA